MWTEYGVALMALLVVKSALEIITILLRRKEATAKEDTPYSSDCYYPEDRVKACKMHANIIRMANKLKVPDIEV